MKTFFAILLLSMCCFAQSQPQKPMNLREVLLEQLRTTHNAKDWFVDANTAVAQLANHLVFWNRQELAKFKGETPEKFSGNNDETFNAFDAAKWTATVQQLDQVMKDWEAAVSSADDKKLSEWASTIAHIGTHNAYHVGQIVFVRKSQGSWDPEKGVK